MNPNSDQSKTSKEFDQALLLDTIRVQTTDANADFLDSEGRLSAGSQAHLLPKRDDNSTYYNDQAALLKALRSKDIQTFNNLITQHKADPYEYKYPNEKCMTCFELVCSSIDSTEIFEILLHNLIFFVEEEKRSEVLNKTNERSKMSPIHAIIDAGFFEYFKILASSNLVVLYVNVNVKIDEGTILHLVLKKIKKTESPSSDVVMSQFETAVKFLLKFQTDVTVKDSKGKTSVDLAAEYNLDNILRIMAECFPVVINVNVFAENTRKKLLKIDPEIKATSDLFREEKLDQPLDVNKMIMNKGKKRTMLQLACIYGLEEVADVLLKNGADPNLCGKNDAENPVVLAFRHGKPLLLMHNLETPIFLSCLYGYYKILNSLLRNETTVVEHSYGSEKASLLHICLEYFEGSYKIYKMKLDIVEDMRLNKLDAKMNVDPHKCFVILINSKRIDVEHKDSHGNTALHYAAKFQNKNAILQLLRRGASINVRNLRDKMPLENIATETMETFLDECITSNERKSHESNYEINFNYSFLKPQNEQADRIYWCPVHEIDLLSEMSKMPRFRPLLDHPTLRSFLCLKWQKLRYLVYPNIFFYFLFWTCLVAYILCDINDERSNAVIVMINLGIAGLTLRELTEFLIFPLIYLKKWDNWLEIILILFTVADVWFKTNIELYLCRIQNLHIIVIMLASFELVHLFGKIPSLSQYIIMLTTVARNFFKSLLCYSHIIISFAICLYALLRNTAITTTTANAAQNSSDVPSASSGDSAAAGEKDHFMNPVMSFFKTILMLGGELEAGDMNFEYFPITSRLVFLMFFFVVPIVLFNLLNGLAISDIQEIKADAHLVGIIMQVELVSYFESLTATIYDKSWLDPGNRNDFLQFRNNFNKYFYALFTVHVSLFRRVPSEFCNVFVRLNEKLKICCFGTGRVKCEARHLCFTNWVFGMDESIAKSAQGIIDRRISEESDTRQNKDKHHDIKQILRLASELVFVMKKLDVIQEKQDRFERKLDDIENAITKVLQRSERK